MVGVRGWTSDLYRVKVPFSGNGLTFNGTGRHLWHCKELSGTVNGPRFDFTSVYFMDE